MLIPCPYCGPRDHHEFSYGGAAHARRPEPDAPEDDWIEYVYMRDNPRGWHEELWHHVSGCRQWLIVNRNTLTHEIASVRAAVEAERLT